MVDRERILIHTYDWLLERAASNRSGQLDHELRQARLRDTDGQAYGNPSALERTQLRRESRGLVAGLGSGDLVERSSSNPDHTGRRDISSLISRLQIRQTARRQTRRRRRRGLRRRR